MTTPTVAGTCLASDQLGKPGSYCRTAAPFCDADAGLCTNGVCLMVATGDLGQPCKPGANPGEESCNQKGLTCASIDGKGDDKLCLCADDGNIGKQCDANGAVCVGNSFNTQFQYIYDNMYATFKDDKTMPIAGKFASSVACFNACPTGAVRANYDGGVNQACYCYDNTPAKAATFVVANDTAKNWTAAYVDRTQFPKTTVPPP